MSPSSTETLPLPPGIRSRHVPNSNGLLMHVLEAGHEGAGRPLALLLHGFPELAFSWRRVMPALAQAGWHVVAPDQRGYGGTTGHDASYDCDLAQYRTLNLVRDTLGLVHALGRRHVDLLVGHDFGAILAPWCALLRPDVFRAMATMSAPFAGPPAIPSGEAAGAERAVPGGVIHTALAALARPRKHYQWYYSTREANDDMLRCRQGVHDFLRAYFHVKSADWEGNRPFRLAGWTAQELARMPAYYIMDLAQDMAATVAPHMPPAEAIGRCTWLPDRELRVYSDAFARTGFQGGLNWYRARTCGRFDAELEVFTGRAVEVPACFIGGASDWGVYQSPGALEAMRERACARMLGCHLVEGAGHWVQQERPQEVCRLLLAFAEQARG